MSRTILTAPSGMIYTNGRVYGTQIYLADNTSENEYTLITKDEYEQIMLIDAELSEPDNYNRLSNIEVTTHTLSEELTATKIILGVE